MLKGNSSSPLFVLTHSCLIFEVLCLIFHYYYYCCCLYFTIIMNTCCEVVLYKCNCNDQEVASVNSVFSGRNVFSVAHLSDYFSQTPKILSSPIFQIRHMVKMLFCPSRLQFPPFWYAHKKLSLDSGLVLSDHHWTHIIPILASHLHLIFVLQRILGFYRSTIFFFNICQLFFSLPVYNCITVL